MLPLQFPRLIHLPGTSPRWLAQAALEGHGFMKVKRGFDIKTNGIKRQHTVYCFLSADITGLSVLFALPLILFILYGLLM